jgi:hypothetical protein
VGQIDHRHLDKADGELGMLVVKIGGPAYRIGMGEGRRPGVSGGWRLRPCLLHVHGCCMCMGAACAWVLEARWEDQVLQLLPPSFLPS